MKKRASRKIRGLTGNVIADFLIWFLFPPPKEKSGGAEITPPKLNYRGPTGAAGDGDAQP